MTYRSYGEQTGAFPAPAAGTGAYGEVFRIIVGQNLAATGIVSVKCGANVIRQFNTPGATGSTEEPLELHGPVDPTQFSITPDAGSHGAFVTYVTD
jgi:hypothetical protein